MTVTGHRKNAPSIPSVQRTSIAALTYLTYSFNSNVTKPPGIVSGGFMFCYTDVYFQREISELLWPIAQKLCYVIESILYFIT